MKQKILFSIVMAATITGYAQTEKKVTGYAITGPQKGQSNWKSVRLVDITTGEEIKTVYSGDMPEPQLLNARTGKPVVKKDAATQNLTKADLIRSQKELVELGFFNKEIISNTTAPAIAPQKLTTTVPATATTPATPASPITEVKVSDATINVVTTINGVTKTIVINRNQNSNVNVNSNVNEQHHRVIIRNSHFFRMPEPKTDAPFATNSAALAYDKKHERLYYTPMGINQLRYIDLKAKTPTLYYFEDEAFGTVTGYWDAANQITRMVIASDGNGYALTNNNEHLIRFTTGKKPEITDLGTLTDDAANGDVSINSRRGYGGDIIADADQNLYLINANRKVFKISIESKVATYVGTIEGLPQGYGTNGAMVEGGSKIIVCSAESTDGYYRVDLNTLQSEKVSTGGQVFNASDLANGNLAFDKKDDKQEEIMPVLAYQAKAVPAEGTVTDGITLYPNPVFDRTVKLSFANQPTGEYKIQLLELSGKVISSREVTINSKVQQIQFNLPQSLAKGSYLVKTVSDVNKVSVINKLIVE